MKTHQLKWKNISTNCESSPGSFLLFTCYDLIFSIITQNCHRYQWNSHCDRGCLFNHNSMIIYNSSSLVYMLCDVCHWCITVRVLCWLWTLVDWQRSCCDNVTPHEEDTQPVNHVKSKVQDKPVKNTSPNPQIFLKSHHKQLLIYTWQYSIYLL